FSQADVELSGHAIECRIYAEDPEHNFMPSPGRIERLSVPHGPNVRDDSGVYEGAEVSIYYDPMISKFAVHGRDRTEAIEKMRRALAEYEIDGIKTTLPSFREVMEDEEFIAGRLDTGFITAFNERRQGGNDSGNIDETDLAVIAAALEDAKSVSAVSVANGNSKPSRWVTAVRSHRS
ncbi:MAG: hypothetical protein QUS14_14145, partial [Pyrinomonadaceae bacterium]|nr:hypothetical protein [Pyrinomonadaceae bacterium]